jgi:hypothetical protein
MVSMSGSTNSTDCFHPAPIFYNLFGTVISNGIFTFSKQETDMEMIAEARVASPKSAKFISSTNLLVSSFGSNEVSGRRETTAEAGACVMVPARGCRVQSERD